MIHLESASKKYQGYYSAILKPAIKKAGLVFTVSETSRNAIHEWLADDSVEVVVATNGCSDEFSPARRRDAEQGYLLFVGNTKPHKNLTTLLKALALLRDVKLVAVTPNVDLVRRAAAALGVSDRVRVLSDVDDRDLAELYANAGATVVPSLIEGFGLPALESICSGTPVVYWRGCESVAEIVGRMGIACDAASSAEEWSDALSRVLANPPKVDPVLARYTHSWDASAQIVSQRLADLAR
ncbi:glycosyltransferase [uncultured Microbacterium sp.]|uniref:glycosyltransferase n=1 Tax=uncultured Microbacterium sp. TaxID=191216 RepID=UPI0026016045|nr:glycosyltransferase [uncultured Microbacterium sp.]